MKVILQFINLQNYILYIGADLSFMFHFDCKKKISQKAISNGS